jgi:hypothetical protein
VDVVAIQDHVVVFSGFLDVLRRVCESMMVRSAGLLIAPAVTQKSRVFGDLVHVYDLGSEQSFIVNVALLQQRSQAITASSEQSWLSLVSLDDPPVLVGNLASP